MGKIHVGERRALREGRMICDVLQINLEDDKRLKRRAAGYAATLAVLLRYYVKAERARPALRSSPR